MVHDHGRCCRALASQIKSVKHFHLINELAKVIARDLPPQTKNSASCSWNSPVTNLLRVCARARVCVCVFIFYIPVLYISSVLSLQTTFGDMNSIYMCTCLLPKSWFDIGKGLPLPCCSSKINKCKWLLNTSWDGFFFFFFILWLLLLLLFFYRQILPRTHKPVVCPDSRGLKITFRCFLCDAMHLTMPQVFCFFHSQSEIFCPTVFSCPSRLHMGAASRSELAVKRASILHQCVKHGKKVIGLAWATSWKHLNIHRSITIVQMAQ